METKNATEVGIESSEEMESKVTKENIINTILSVSSTVEPETEPEIEVLKFAMKKYCSIRETLFNDLKTKCELEIGSALYEKLNPVLTARPYNSFSARSQNNFAH